MNGENDKLIGDFINAFEKKDVKVAMKDVNLAYQVLAAGRNSSHRELHRPRQPGPYPSNRPRELLENCPPFKPQPAIR